MSGDGVQQPVTVSVVIPALDDAEMLERCLETLAAQRMMPHEVIVVDNGSSDHTVLVARAHGATVIAERRTGIGYAASTGYDAARGEVVARCDADSLLPVDWIDRIALSFVESDERGAVTGPGTFYGAPWLARCVGDVFYMRAYFAIMRVTLGHPALFGSNVAFRRSLWLTVRDEVHNGAHLHDDIDLSYHLGDLSVVRYDRSLRVGISARPLRSARGLVLRWRRGVRSVLTHWPDEAPWRRWSRRRGRVDRRPLVGAMSPAPARRTP